jgi:hypothetical protein
MPRNEAQAGYWSVSDKNARTARRTHEVNGRRYNLDAVEPTYMPQEDARVFLKDAAFEVRDESDVLQLPLPSKEAEGERAVRQLDPDECIARYDELTTAALLARVANRPGGAAIDAAAPREQLIAFLQRAPVTRAAAPGEAARVEPGQPDIVDLDNPAMGKLPTMDEMLQGV